MSDSPEETPFIELLRGVETNAVGSYEMRDGGSHHVPFGRYCHQAADRIADLESRLAAAEANAERLLGAARNFSAETKEARKKYASVMTFAMVCAMDKLEKVVMDIDAARGGE